jgi:hypothetical protein
LITPVLEMFSPHVTILPSGVSTWGTLKSPQRICGAGADSPITVNTPSSISIVFQPLLEPGGMCVVWTVNAPAGVAMSAERMRSGQGAPLSKARDVAGHLLAITKP